ncbi:transcription factor TFIIF complex subunit Tfg3 [Coemansia sp. RSA 2399]|nr:transcription factor TFIIF complex subunit Tfg3 [Coemansia sp. RSA 2399]
METEVVLGVHTQHRETGRTVVSGGIEYSLRTWSCTLQEGRARMAGSSQLPYIQKVEFIMHETFDNPHKVVSHAPFRVEEEGWGEFDLVLVVHLAHSSDSYKIVHDLSFHEGESYTKRYSFSVPSPTAGFLALFNKPSSTFSRKTIPARATKARKGPPKDSAYANAASRLSSASELSSDSDLTDAASDSEDASVTATSHQRDKDGSSVRPAIAHTHTPKDVALMRASKPRSVQVGGASARPEGPAAGLVRHRRPPPDPARAASSRGTSSSSASAPKPGSKRRLSDVNDSSATAGLPSARRGTMGGKHTAGGERDNVHGLPPQQQQQEAVSEAHGEQPKHSMASAIASMRVPKKQALASRTTPGAASAAPHTDAASSSRDAFIRERERQRHVAQEVEPHSAKSETLPNDAAVRRKPTKREAEDTPVPNRQRQRPAKAVAIADHSPKHQSSETDYEDTDLDTIRMSPRLARRIERIIECASLLSENQIVGFLRLLHALRIQQDPDSAQTMTAQAIDRVRFAGKYSCDMSALPPAAIDKLWAFVQKTRA